MSGKVMTAGAEERLMLAVRDYLMERELTWPDALERHGLPRDDAHGYRLESLAKFAAQVDALKAEVEELRELRDIALDRVQDLDHLRHFAERQQAIGEERGRKQMREEAVHVCHEAGTPICRQCAENIAALPDQPATKEGTT